MLSKYINHLSRDIRYVKTKVVILNNNNNKRSIRLVASLLASSTLLQDDNNLFQTCQQLGTNSANTLTSYNRRPYSITSAFKLMITNTGGTTINNNSDNLPAFCMSYDTVKPVDNELFPVYISHHD